MTDNVSKNQGSNQSYHERAAQCPPKKKKCLQSSSNQEHPVLPSCVTCKFKCNQNFSDETRRKINKLFWSMTSSGRRLYFSSHVEKKNVARRTTRATSKRQSTYVYRLTDNHGKSEPVCKKFFLRTLGFKGNSSSLIKILNERDPVTLTLPQDRRGTTRDRTIHENRLEAIRKHVESFHPHVSHYRRKHAPNRRYLPSELTITKMFEDFCEKHASLKCSYETYRHTLKEMKISFTKLGHEQCETCEEFEQHNLLHSKEKLCSSCTVCINWSAEECRRVTQVIPNSLRYRFNRFGYSFLFCRSSKGYNVTTYAWLQNCKFH